ncbi:MAG: hypothetical protein II970_03310 [Paludibacteraceae bacterium]|nr:hypothetical protein [Paludibacteraceae bacterium]
MKKSCIIYILVLCTALLGVSCSKEHESDLEVPVQAPLSLCLPAGELMSAQSAPQRRIMGDPGLAERFRLPRYVYIFMLRQNQSGNWVVYDKIEDELDAGSWEKTHYTGRLQTDGDTIFRYTRQVTYMLTSDRFNGRVYAIMSAEQLTFDKSLSDVNTLKDVEDLRFSMESDNIQRNVQHIYSSPYNYEVDDDYYGSFSSIGNDHPSVNLMLYHVAAKVDIKWNVAADKRINREDPAQAVRLTSMRAHNLYDGWSYIFRPMENQVNELPSTGYSINDIVTPTDEGLWWEGRYYFYTIPYRVGNEHSFPLQLVMGTNNLAGDGYRLTINQPFDPTSPFVPWVRADLRLSRPLGNETHTYNIGE